MTIQRYGQTHGTAAAWTAADDTYEAGVEGIETDTGFRKTFDGVTSWNNLSYNHPWPYVRAASTGNVAISTALENGDTLDGVTLATGNLVLLKDQTTPAENGPYFVQASGAAVRAMFVIRAGTIWLVAEGTVNHDTAWWVTTNDPITVGSTAITIAAFGGGYVPGGTDVAITDGGTGVSSLPTGILKGAGTGAITAATAGTDYYNPGGTDVAVADGGTGSSTASAARTALGVAIGTDVEAHDPDLTTIAGLSPSNDDLLQRKSGAWANRTVAQLKTDLALTESDITGLVTDLAAKQPLDSDLTTIAGLTATTDNMIQSVGSAWASRTPSQVKAALAIAESDVTNLTTDLAAKQPLDADLTTIAGLTATTDNFIVAVASAWASRTPSQVRTTLALVIGTNVQAWDADLDTWATKTPPSGAAVGTTDTQTLTNKRRQPRVNAQASTSTLTPEIDTYDIFRLTAQAAALTIANHSTSTPADGEQIKISILDNGTARALTFGTNYVARGGIALPTTTVISKLLTLGFEWYDHLTKWVLTASALEA